MFFFLIIRLPPTSTRTYTLFPYTTLFRSMSFVSSGESCDIFQARLNTRAAWSRDRAPDRSEEHTSELQSLMRISYAVFCLKKKRRIVLMQLLYRLFHLLRILTITLNLSSLTII